MKKHPPKCRHEILEAYQQHLCTVAGLSPKTCQHHRSDLRHFLEAVPIRQASDLAKLTPVHLARYLTGRSIELQPASLRQVAGSLRRFLRFAEQQGWTTEPLRLAVPQIACRGQNDLPVYLTQEQLDLLLASWDGSTAQGKRDLAIGLCLARLGLRAGEVAALVLEDQRLPRTELSAIRPQTISLMPNGLLNILSWDELHDLLAFLETMGIE